MNKQYPQWIPESKIVRKLVKTQKLKNRQNKKTKKAQARRMSHLTDLFIKEWRALSQGQP